MRNDLTERLAATVYKQGEAKQKAGDAAGAVEDYPARGAASRRTRRSARPRSMMRPRS